MSFRTALITGASSGIGRGLCLRLARDGTRVFAAARRERELRALAAEIQSLGGRCDVVVLDVADTASCVARIREIDAEVGGLDLIVANAGVGIADDNLPPHAWENLKDAFHVNVCGALATLTAVLPDMQARRRGHLCGIGSISSYGPLPRAAAYSAPKAGLAMLLGCLRLDLASSGVKVTTVHAGFVDTPMLAAAKHPLPGLMSVDRAVAHIVRGLYRGQAVIAFPWWLAFLARLASTLPRPLHDTLMRLIG